MTIFHEALRWKWRNRWVHSGSFLNDSLELTHLSHLFEHRTKQIELLLWCIKSEMGYTITFYRVLTFIANTAWVSKCWFNPLPLLKIVHSKVFFLTKYFFLNNIYMSCTVCVFCSDTLFGMTFETVRCTSGVLGDWQILPEMNMNSK